MGSCAYLPATFTKRVTVQAVSRQSDGQGGFTETWADVTAVWCSLEPLKAYERFQAMQLATPVTHRLVMRYTAAVTTACRLRLGTRVFDVTEVIDDRDRHRFLTVKAVETPGLPAAATSRLLREDGFVLLLEDGSTLLLEAA